MKYIIKIWKKVKLVKAKLGLMGDLAIVLLFFWFLENHVPYGQLISNAIMIILGAMVLFSVSYVIFLKASGKI